MPMDKDISISADGLQIRVLGSQDIRDFFDNQALPEVSELQSWQPGSVKEIEEFVAANLNTTPATPDAWLQWAACLKIGKLIREIGIHFLSDNSQAEIGYSLSPVYEGKG